MKFKICTVDIWNDPEKIAAEYPCVNDFGFESEALTITYPNTGRTIERVQPYVNIDNLEKLLEFCKAVEQPLIISLDGDIPEIEIYDSYRE